MFDADYLAQLEAGYQSSKPKKKTGRGGPATSLISEGGALGGAMAGATIGSAIPIFGTVIGGAIGAGLGAFGGRLAENKVRDNRWGVGDAAKEGAISAVLGAPLRTARYATTAAKSYKEANAAAKIAEALRAAQLKNAATGTGGAVMSGIANLIPRSIPVKVLGSESVGSVVPSSVRHTVTGGTGTELVNDLVSRGYSVSTRSGLTPGSINPITGGERILTTSFTPLLPSPRLPATEINAKKISIPFNEGNTTQEIIRGNAGLNPGAISVTADRASRLPDSLVSPLTKSERVKNAFVSGAQAADAPGMLASALKGKVANVATGVRNDAALKNFKINDSNWISAFQKNVGEDPGAFASRLGFATSSPKEVAKNLYNPTQSVYTAYLSGVPAISKKELSSALDGKIAQYAKSAVPEQRNIGEQLAALKKDLLTRLPGSKLTALEARDLKSQFQSAVDQKLTDTAGKLNNSVNKQVADVLREAINTKAEKAGIKIDPVNLPYKGSKATTLAELGTELRGIKEFADKAAIKQNVGRGKNPLGITPLIGGGAGAALGPVGAAGGIATSALANSHAGRKAEYALADKLAQMSTKQKGTLRTGAGIGTRATLASALAGNQSSPLDPSISANNQASSISDAPPMNANIDTQYTQTPDMSIQQSSPFDPANIEANVLNMMQQGATMKDVQGYLSMAETINSMKQAAMPKVPKPLSAEASKVVSNSYSGIQSLDALEGMLQQDPSILRKTAIPGRGIAGGLIGNAVGTAGYDNLSRNILDVITRLRTGAALTASEEKFYKQQLPQAYDSPEVVQQKLGMFRDLFSSVAGRASSGGMDATNLIAALGG